MDIKEYQYKKLMNKCLQIINEVINGTNKTFKKTESKYLKLSKRFNIMRSNSFAFGNKTITLNKEQMGVVYDQIHTNMLVLASAGSGKTTTIICRIKYLIDQGIDPRSIILTTFTRDATNDMKKKLDTMFGFKIPIEVGTIDSISKRNIIKYGKASLDNTVNVSEYGIRFLRFLQSDPNRMEYLSQKKYMFVDEFQDINDVQSDIITEFYKVGVKIIAVGDDSQNIYSFRGSNIEHILTFSKKYNNVSIHTLIRNYRSTPEIIKFANESIEKNIYQIPKKMKAVNKSINKLPTIKFYYSWELQNLFIRDKILEYISKGIPKHEIAILSRTKFPLFSLEETLTKNGIDNVLLDGEGDVRVKIKEEHVCVSTVHKAKGLEWQVVFIVNLNDNSFPSGKSPIELEEERRLFYVAITRAKQYLHMSFYPSCKSIYVSRFISEIEDEYYDFENYDVKYIGIVDDCSHESKLSIPELVKNLDGVDYMKLRDLSILPNIEFIKTQIYEKFEYLDFIKENDIYSDFSVFIDCLITRMIGQMDHTSNGLFYEPAMLAIANIKLSTMEYNIYKKYDINFKNKLEFISLEDTDDQIISKLEDVAGVNYPISQQDRNIIVKIVDKLFANASKFDVPFYKIPIFSERYLPEDFEILMENQFANFTNRKSNWLDIIKCIWEIAKCNKIVNDGRRRLLYKDFNLEDLMKYSKLYQNIYECYVKGLEGIEKKCNLNLKLDNGVFGSIDLLANGIVIDINTSNNKDMDATWILHLLCYTHLCRINGYKASRIQIFNPLTGNVFIAKISDWDKGAELIEYLLDKRTKLLERTKMLQLLQEKQQREINEFKENGKSSKLKVTIPKNDFFQKKYMFT